MNGSPKASTPDRSMGRLPGLPSRSLITAGFFVLMRVPSRLVSIGGRIAPIGPDWQPFASIRFVRPAGGIHFDYKIASTAASKVNPPVPSLTPSRPIFDTPPPRGVSMDRLTGHRNRRLFSRLFCFPEPPRFVQQEHVRDPMQQPAGSPDPGHVKMSNGTLSVGTLTVVINGTDDAPVLTGTQATLAAGTEDTNYTINASDLLAGFSDVDGDTLSVSGLTADHGSLVNNGDGTWTFTPAGRLQRPGQPQLQRHRQPRRQRRGDAELQPGGGERCADGGCPVEHGDLDAREWRLDQGCRHCGDGRSIGHQRAVAVGGGRCLVLDREGVGGKELHFNGGANFETKAGYDVDGERQ